MKDSRKSYLIEVPEEPLGAGLAFIRHSRFLLREDLLVKIRSAVGLIEDEKVWFRPNEATNSIGNLILHIAGNMRQWMISGIAGAPDNRDRPSEFAARESMSKDALLAFLASTVDEVDSVLESVEKEIQSSRSDAPLQRVIMPQGYAQTVLDAVYHVAEHFSHHTGQIIQLAKWQEGDKVRLYDDRELEQK